MKFVEPNRFADPDAAARKLLEIANATEPAQDGRIYIELVNAAFLKAGGTGEEFAAAIKRETPVWATIIKENNIRLGN